MSDAVQLQPATLAAFDEYVAMTAQPESPFLWCDGSAARAEMVRQGQTVAQLWAGSHPIHVADGLIHDWIGATFIPDAVIGKTLALVQSYDRHKDIYREVIDSRLVSRVGNVFEIYLRLLKKKVVTVVLDTDHHVEYTPASATQWRCRSRSTRIAEVENAGKANERVCPPDTGHGFLWRLCSDWRFEQRDGGVWVECRAISLTRDVPKGLGWMMEPIVKKLPRESLMGTLDATRSWYGK